MKQFAKKLKESEDLLRKVGYLSEDPKILTRAATEVNTKVLQIVETDERLSRESKASIRILKNLKDSLVKHQNSFGRAEKLLLIERGVFDEINTLLHELHKANHQQIVDITEKIGRKIEHHEKNIKSTHKKEIAVILDGMHAAKRESEVLQKTIPQITKAFSDLFNDEHDQQLKAQIQQMHQTFNQRFVNLMKKIVAASDRLLKEEKLFNRVEQKILNDIEQIVTNPDIDEAQVVREIQSYITTFRNMQDANRRMNMYNMCEEVKVVVQQITSAIDSAEKFISFFEKQVSARK